MAAPMPTPAKPASAMGVSMTRLRTELLEHPLADLVGALVVADLFAHQEDAVVALHLLDHRLAQGLSEPERSRHRPRLAAMAKIASSGVNRRTGRCRLRPRARRAPGSGLSSANFTASATSASTDFSSASSARLVEARLGEALARARCSGSRFLCSSSSACVRYLAGIAHRVAAEAVGAHLDERGRALLSRALDGLADAPLDLEHVVGEEAVAVHPVAERLERDVLDRHRARERRAHRVLVVLADEDDGQLPQRGERRAPRGSPPMLTAPSPKKQSVTRPSPRYLLANATPAASGMWPPTMP